jgi:NitT/TauT family transport system ATP-binding protein
VKLHAQGIERTFGSGPTAVHALGPLDLEVRDGEFVCLVGPSGCGKSTFVKIVAGLLDPTAGRMDINFSGRGLAPVATVFQDFGIFPWKTVEGNVTFALRVRGVGKAEALHRAHEWLAKLGLKDFAKAYPTTLSGGMRQRVAIARALAVEPEILLMDEPFASLDAQLREILQEELLAIHQSTGRTVIFVTHSLDEAIVLADRVVVMTARPGRLLDDTTVPFQRPRTPEIRETAEFAQLRGQLWDHLRREVDAQFERNRESN